MATLKLLSLNSLFVSICLLSCLDKSFASSINGRKLLSHDHDHHHILEVTSLIPSTSCIPSTKAKVLKRGSGTLEVVHKHGPCHKYKDDKESVSSHFEILEQDEIRVNAINSRISNGVEVGSGNSLVETDSTNLPAKSGRSLNSGNYIVTIGLGSPATKLSLVFDTGSDVTWTQCQPCVKSCYQQQDPIFDPSKSTSYANVSCASSTCNALISATGNKPGCASSTCVYGVQYGDSSYSVGFFAQDRLSLTATDVFDNFYFGCGQDNEGLFGKTAGLLGLGRDPLSLVSQTARKYNKVFSYCLPSTPSRTGHLTFGGAPSSSAKYTQMATISAGSSFYGIIFNSISVGGSQLQISNTVFTNAGSLIDSGTVITRFPPDAYTALKTAFRQGMSKYPMAPALSILDTCYDFSNYSTISVPKITFTFSGGAVVDLDVSGILYVASQSQVCLGFAGNSDANDVLIFGNTQQKTLEVVYDGAKGRLGFASRGCS